MRIKGARQRPRGRGAALRLGLLLVAGGCSGGSGETARVPVTPVMRLSPLQYENAVADLLNVRSFPDKGQLEDPLDREGVPTHPTVGLSDARSYLSSAEAVAQGARDSGTLGQLAACDMPGEPAAATACAEQFIRSFGKRALRRAPSDEEVETLRGVYERARRGTGEGGLGLDYLGGVQVVLETLLNLPQFLYAFESGERRDSSVAGDVVPLSAPELATRLSLFLWQTLPDEALLTAAADGRLSSREGLSGEVRRMLGDGGRKEPRAERGVRAFMRRWMSLGDASRVRKSASLFPFFDDATRESLAAETEQFASYAIFEDDGRLETLLTAPYTFVNLPLASIYGVDKSRLDGQTLTKVALDPAVRAGILTQPSFLAARAHSADTSPTLRGLFIRQRLMCETLAPPPPTADTTPPAVDFSVPTRERYKEHSNNPSCAGCHVRMDPVGAGFDQYDAAGGFRKYVGKYEIDGTGQVYYSKDLDGPFAGPVELAKRLAASPSVEDCFVRQLFRFASARYEDNEQDQHSLEVARAGFARGGHDIRRLLAEIALSDAFRYRRIGEGEGQP